MQTLSSSLSSSSRRTAPLTAAASMSRASPATSGCRAAVFPARAAAASPSARLPSPWPMAPSSSLLLRQLGRRETGVAVVVPRSLKSENAAETDWRVKEMMDSVRAYFAVWSGKDPSTIDALLSDDFVHVDEIWSGAEVVAGRANFRAFVARTREAYPDLAISVEDSGAAGSHRVFVRWSGSATNLGRYHGAKASRHASALSGIDLFTFSKDRSRLEEVLVYRTPLAEDKVQLESFEAENHGLHELKLHRLHDEQGGGGGSGGGAAKKKK